MHQLMSACINSYHQHCGRLNKFMHHTFLCMLGLCDVGQFPCLTEGLRCIEEAYRCDGIPDCVQSVFPFEAFDEQLCPDNGGLAWSLSVMLRDFLLQYAVMVMCVLWWVGPQQLKGL